MKQIKKILKFIIVLACIIYLVRFFYANRDSLQIAFNLNFLTIVYIIVLSIIYLLLYSYRFKIILEKCSGCRVPFFPWFKILILSRFLNMVFSQMGNIYRGLSLKKDYNISYTRYISSFTSFAWMDTCLNLITGIVVIVIVKPDMKVGQFEAWLVLLVLICIALPVPVAAQILLRKTNFKYSSLVWVKSKLSEVLTVTFNNLKDKIYLSRIIILGLVLFGQSILGYYILFRSFDIRLGLPELAVFYILLKVSFFFQITPGNIGIQEIAHGFLGEQIGVGMAEGILVSVVIRIISTTLIILLGLFSGGIDLLRHRKDYAKSAD